MRCANSVRVVGQHRGPDVGLEVVQSAPGATGGAVRALEAGDRRLDARPFRRNR